MARANRHHLWWPRRDYQTKLERKFRQLPCNIVRMDARVHAILHLVQAPPRKPPVSFMREQVDRHKSKSCACFE